MPERPERQPLVERAAGDEPARAMPGLDQSLITEQLERPTYGRPGHRVPAAQLGLAVDRPVLADLAKRDALAQVVRDPSERRTCHEVVSYEFMHGVSNQTTSHAR